MSATRPRYGFTLVELLVSIAVLTMLIAILLPSLSKARKSAKSTVCKTRLHDLGAGISMYVDDNDDALMPSRMPKIDSYHWTIHIEGGRKYRPTFLAILGSYVAMQPFNDPAPQLKLWGDPQEMGDRQNYSQNNFVCPSVPDWRDERNAAYGYNYQFLGNSRLYDDDDEFSFKNWPVKMTIIKSPGNCVVIGDSMGTAAGSSRFSRGEYQDNGRDHYAMGNEGFNLDPPTLDPENGEIAEREEQKRSAVHERHLGLCSILWLDGHTSGESYKTLGYVLEENDVVGLTGNNRLWHPRRLDRPWLLDPPPP